VALEAIAANLAMGITFSTIAKNQLQAMQMTFFVFLPSILLPASCFVPRHAALGPMGRRATPLTHFLRTVRGILLKETDGTTSSCPCADRTIRHDHGHGWRKRYRQTLD
jgi:ABC-2 type transport system permease protein